MLRRLFAIVLSVVCGILLWTAAGHPDNDQGGGLFVFSLPHHPGELDDAITLAAFGEPQSAYSLVPARVDDPVTERERLSLELRLLTELEQYRRADSLLAVHTPISGPESEFLHYFRRARLNQLAGKPESALAFLSATDSLDGGGFEPYRDFMRVTTLLALERPDDAIRAGAGVLKNGIPEPLTPELQMALILACSQASRPRDGLELVKQLRRKTRLSTQKAGLLALEYQLYQQAGESATARKKAVKLARVYRNNPRAAEVSRDALQAFGAAGMTVDELLALAGVFVEHGMYRQYKTVLRELDDRTLRGAQREERLIVKARYYYRKGDFRSAAALAKPRYEVPAYRRESMLILARSWRRMGKKVRAADLYGHFASTWPNDAKASEALYVAARLYRNEGERAKLDEVLERLRKSYPSSYFGRMAIYQSAGRYTGSGRNKQAVAILDGAVRRSRGTDETAIYYLAQACRATGDDSRYHKLIKELEELDPYSFYLSPVIPRTTWRPVTNSTGGLALDGEDGLVEFLLRAAERRENARKRLSQVVGAPRGGIIEAGECLSRGVWFMEAGFRDWGERELEDARKRCFNSPGDLLELGRIYDIYGMPWQSIRLYQRVKDSVHWKKRREFADQFRYLMYPVPYPVNVLENAGRFGLPPQLVYAMIREESRFDRAAVSRVGALGLMQLMPETGRYVARELDVPEWIEDHLLDPATNLAFGIWYASSLMNGSDGDYLRMLAAYNAGPSNARRWFAGPRPERAGAGENNVDGQTAASTIEIVDGIDFRETRLYVQRIVESANIYHSLYFDEALHDDPSGF